MITFLLSYLLESCVPFHLQVSHAVKQSVSFLEKQPFEYDYAFLYTYLQQKNVDVLEKINHQENALKMLLDTSEVTPELLFYKLVDPNYTLPKSVYDAIVQTEETDAMTITALYCDSYPIDENSYLKWLEKEAAIGNYQASHALLSLIWLKEKHCVLEKHLEKLETKLITATKNNIREEEDWTDLKIESIALVQAGTGVVDKKMIVKLLSEQNEDGGFPMKPDTYNSHTHTTILAIWALLPHCRNKK